MSNTKVIIRCIGAPLSTKKYLASVKSKRKFTYNLQEARVFEGSGAAKNWFHAWRHSMGGSWAERQSRQFSKYFEVVPINIEEV